VNYERITVVEMEQLVFSSALYAIDALSLERTRLSRGQFSLEGWMDRLDRRDSLADRRSTEPSGSAFNLGKLWHSVRAGFPTQSFVARET
jgi:hypothetical protein